MLQIHANGIVELVKIGILHVLMEQLLLFVMKLTIVIGTNPMLVLAFHLVLIMLQIIALEINGVQHNQELVLITHLLHVHHLQQLLHALELIQKQQDVLGLMIIHVNHWEKSLLAQILTILQLCVIIQAVAFMKELLAVLKNAQMPPLKSDVTLLKQVIPPILYALGLQLVVLVVMLLIPQPLPKITVIKEHIEIINGHLTINVLLVMIWLTMMTLVIQSFWEHLSS